MRMSAKIFTFTILCVIHATLAQFPEYAKEVSSGINQFSVIFYQNVISYTKNKNLIVSPLSANMVLSMISYGAEGETLERLQKALYMPRSRSVALRGYWDLINAYNHQAGVTLGLANKVLLANNLQVNTQFYNLTKHIFQSEAAVLDVHKPAEMAEAINQWVETKTHNKIKDLVSSADIDQQTRLLLLNAVYFKGEWAMIVREENTVDKPFYVDENTKINVPTMYMTGSFISDSVPALDAEFFALPYKNEDFNMVFLVPKKIDGLSFIEKNFGLLNMTSLMKSYRKTMMLHVPKFKIESTVDLKEPLNNMGFHDLFGNTIYSHISAEPLQVSKVLQKSFVEVNEKGSEAGSATVMLMNRSFSNNIRVDRPSLFLITKGDQILFIGRIVNPSEN